MLLVTTALLLGTVGMILGHCALQGYFASGQCRDTTPWAPQEYCGAGHCRDTLLSGAAGIPSGCCHYCAVTGHCKDTLWLRTAGILGGWALQGYSAVAHCRDTLPLSAAGILGGWALQEYLVVRHCRDAWFGGWALQGYSAIGHCIDTQQLGTAGILCGWALLQGYSAVGPFKEALPFCSGTCPAAPQQGAARHWQLPVLGLQDRLRYSRVTFLQGCRYLQ